jgi:acyl carrier protein
VRERVLALVAEKTGYPPDMLALDLDLEADLGIDTVKQAEVFAAIREAYGIARDDKLRLRDYPTLAHVIGFVRERRPDLAGSAAAAAPAAVASLPAAAASPPVAAAPAVAAPGDAGGDPVRERVLALVAEKTGYPPDMLALDLDLEADLGIDTVKQAEVFAAIREAYGIARDDKLRLRDYPTLAHVIGFVRERKPDLAGSAADAARGAVPGAAASAPAKPEPPAVRSFEAAGRVPRRVPVPMLRAPLALCTATGVALGAGSRVLVAADRAGAAEALTRVLEAQGAAVLSVASEEDGEALEARVRGWLAQGGVQGVYWLPALDAGPGLDALDPAGWRALLRARVKRLYTVMRLLWDAVGTPSSFLVAATRLGGQHGYDLAGALEPLGGAVTGFVKAYKRERPEALVKAVDFSAEAGPEEIASSLLDETLRDPGAIEIGRVGELRCGIGLEERSVEDGGPGLALGPESVFVVTGAAGSIVSAIVADLAAASGGGSFHLVDRVPEPDPLDPDLARFASDREGLKRELAERLRARGDRPTPVRVERELAGLERSRAALDAIEAVTRAGGKVRWHAVDLLDEKAVEKAMHEVRAGGAPVDVVLHAAGLESSRQLPDKDRAEFDRVFDVKSDGFFHVLHGLGEHPLRAVVGFSSIAGRFGNGGQTDYSAANDLLCKCLSHLRRMRPEVRALAVDWTGWAKIGMAARGSIPVLLGQAGIELLDPDAGIPWVRRELTLGGARGEVVVAGALGVLARELDAGGGFDAAALGAAPGAGPMLAGARGRMTQEGVFFETRLDPAQQPFLDDHRIEGTPVLPGVMGLEGFAEAASLLAPGWRLAAVEEVRFLAPFKFYRDAPRDVILRCVATPEADAIVACCELLGTRVLAGQPEPTTSLHFSGRVRLVREAPAPQRASVPTPPAEKSCARAEDVYRLYFHGPAYRVIDRAWRQGPGAAALLASALPPNHAPPALALRAAPRLVEACFQVAGLWEMAERGRLALPHSLASVAFLLPPEEATGWLFAVATPDPEGEAFGATVVDASGRALVRLRGYRTVALPEALDAERAAPLRAAFGGGSGT